MISKWLTDLLLRDGPACHLCGLPIAIFNNTDLPLGPSRDHIVPNPFTKASGYNKRAQPGKRAPANSPSNLKLAHRYCSSRRGQLEITEELKVMIRTALLAKIGRKCGRSADQVLEGFSDLRQQNMMWLACQDEQIGISCSAKFRAVKCPVVETSGMSLRR
jgi:hypothetical protein